jgi:iron(III) transport system substrate-binding protein
MRHSVTNRRRTIGGVLAALAVGSRADRAAFATARQRLVVHSVLGQRNAQPLLDEFRRRYPEIELEYDGSFSSADLSERVKSGGTEARDPADVIWSSAMDLQVALVSEGYAATYSPQPRRDFPSWVGYEDRAVCTTLEPSVFIYNRRLLAADDVPKNRGDLLRFLQTQRARLEGRITTIDIASSGVAYMLAVQDRLHYPDYPLLISRLGAAKIQLETGTGTMLERVNSGKYLFGLNAMGAYAVSRSLTDLPDLGVVFPNDYTLALSRVALINKAARNPDGARLWLDFLLSRDIQRVFSTQLNMIPVRRRVTPPRYAATIGDALKPIRMSAALTDHLDAQKQRNFMSEWTQLLGSRA